CERAGPRCGACGDRRGVPAGAGTAARRDADPDRLRARRPGEDRQEGVRPAEEGRRAERARGRRVSRFVSQAGRGVTDFETTSSLLGMNPWTELLTKRRAVDFCRVATALCRAA